jgi:hypothetical protein
MIDDNGPATFGLAKTDGICLPAEITDLIPAGGDPQQPVLFGKMVGEGKFLSGGLLYPVQISIKQDAAGTLREGFLRVTACSTAMGPNGPVCELKLHQLNATSFSQVRFHDDAASTPDGLPADPSNPMPDTIAAAGEGTWDGAAGYTFTLTASDRGEPGVGLDTFAITGRAPDGTVVGAGAGTLIEFNLEASSAR